MEITDQELAERLAFGGDVRVRSGIADYIVATIRAYLWCEYQNGDDVINLNRMLYEMTGRN